MKSIMGNTPGVIGQGSATMNDTIAELTALEAKVKPTPWVYIKRKTLGPNIFFKEASGQNNYLFDECCEWGEDTSKLIVAVRNALPELLHYAKASSEAQDECESLQNDLDDAKDWISDMIKVACKYFPQVEVGDDGDYYVADMADAIRMKLADDEKERDAALARAVKAEAERDEAMRHLPEECPFDCGFGRPDWCDLQVESIEYGDCGCSVGPLPCWSRWITQEAAKRGEGTQHED